MHQPPPVLGVVSNVLSPGFALHSHHHPMLGILQMSENHGAEIALLVDIRIKVLGHTVCWIIGDFPNIFLISRILAIALQPHSVVQLRFLVNNILSKGIDNRLGNIFRKILFAFIWLRCPIVNFVKLYQDAGFPVVASKVYLGLAGRPQGQLLQ